MKSPKIRMKKEEEDQGRKRTTKRTKKNIASNWNLVFLKQPPFPKSAKLSSKEKNLTRRNAAGSVSSFCF